MTTQKPGDNRIFLYGPIPSTGRGPALFTPDGQQVVQILYRRRSTMPDELNIWNTADGKWLRKIDLIQETKIVSFALDPAGQIAATGMEDGRILLVEPLFWQGSRHALRAYGSGQRASILSGWPLRGIRREGRACNHLGCAL